MIVLNWTIMLLFIVGLLSEISVNGGGCENSSVNSFTLNGHYVRWPSQKMAEEMIKTRRYIAKNIVYTRFQLCEDNVFLAAPRYKNGVPFTIGKISLKNDSGDIQRSFDTYVEPFPRLDNIETDKESYSAGILVNVVDLVMDTNGILWVLDIGISDTLNEIPSVVDDRKVVGIEVATGNIRHSISLRSLDHKSQSPYQNLFVEETKNGATFLYVGDGRTRSIVVWHVQNNEGRRVNLPHSVVESCSEHPQNDVFNMALVEHIAGNYIYFSYMSNCDVFRIRTKNLQNRQRTNFKSFVNIGKNPGRMVFVGVGYGSILYFRLGSDGNLYSWDTKLPLIEDNMKLVRKNRDYRIITHVDVDNESKLWVLESNIQDFMNNEVGCYGPSVLLSAVHDAPVPITNDFDE